MRNFTMFMILLAFPAFCGAEPMLEEKTVLDGKVTMLLPKDFNVMSDEMLKAKYPAARRPTLVFTNERGTVNIALNHTNDRVEPEKLPELYKAVEGTMKRAYPSAEWFRSEMTKINGREFLLLDLRTPAVDTEVRNVMAGTSLDGRLLLFSFNVTKELEKEWLKAGNKMIESIKVK